MYETREFRKGLKLEINGDPYTIVDFSHYNPGKGAAFTRIKIKNLKTGQVLEQNVKSGEKVKPANLDQRKMQYLYNDAEGYHFMDTENYEQFSLQKEDLEETIPYLLENAVVSVLFFQGKAISVELDTFVQLAVKETPPGIRGNTATGGSKQATMETGLVVNVPFHINEGDVLKIDTRTSEYVEKVKS